MVNLRFWPVFAHFGFWEKKVSRKKEAVIGTKIKNEAVIGTKFDFRGKKIFFARMTKKLCPYDPKIDDCETFSKHDSKCLGTAPALERWCRPSFRVVGTFFIIVDSGSYEHFF